MLSHTVSGGKFDYRPGVADWEGGMSANCAAGLGVR